MAKIRFGYSDDFTAKNSGVGINTTDPQTNLDVVGVVKGQDLRVTGVSLQTGYEGFLRADHQIEEETQLNFGQGINASLSGEIIVGTGQTVTVTENLKEDRFGPELITNGQFLSNVDNWTANDSSNSLNNGRMRITRSGGNGRATYQIITSLVPGATYFASAIVDSIGSRGDFRVKKGSLWTNNAYLLTSGTNGQVKTLSGSFTATGTTALVGFAIDNDSTVIEVDQVTVRRVNDVEELGTNVAGGSQIECMKVYDTFTPPSGGINDRPYKPKPGQLYYNYDFKTIEFHDGYGWRQVDYTSRSGRGVFANGRVGSTPYNTIDMITIPSLGNAVDFGDSTQNAISPSGVGNGTRGIFAGGYAPAPGTTIEYVTMASQGNAISFGSITPAGRRFMASAASSTRGVFFGGRLNPTSAQTAEIKYIEMGTLGNTQDFGNLSGGADMRGAAASSPTRGVYTTGTQVAPSGDNRNEYVTIAAKSNSVEFGDLTVGRQYQAASSNSVRMVIGGGAPLVNPGGDKTMDYITIASLGNAIDFGNLTVGRYSFSSVSTQTRAVWVGGSAGAPNDNYNVLDYVEISTLGDAMDFGDLTEGRYGTAAASDSHGGLGGF